MSDTYWVRVDNSEGGTSLGVSSTSLYKQANKTQLTLWKIV